MNTLKLPEKESKPEAIEPVVLMEKVKIDLAPGAGNAINYAGRQYVHGASYELPVDVAWGVKEIMNRGHSHEASLKDATDYTKRRGRAFA